jgi:CO dehydrogenase maturation factor
VILLKIAVCGKGGVGKTLVAATIARFLGREGIRVLAVDADPNTTLATALGIPAVVAETIVPLTENEELVKERTGLDPKTFGGMFKINPRVEDLATKFGVVAPDNVTLLVAGTVKVGGSGCMCPAGALLKALIRHLIVSSGEAFVMDMEAGIENLGRGTTRGMDALIIVVEPGHGALATVGRIQKLAGDLGVERLIGVANKIMNDEDKAAIESVLAKMDIPLLAVIPFDSNIRQAGLLGKAPLDFAPSSPAIQILKTFVTELQSFLEE